MKIPNTGRRKALVIIDLQPAFIKPHNKHIIERIATTLEAVTYDAYVEAVFSAEKGSIWDVQQDWICPRDENSHTVEKIQQLLKPKRPLQIHKHTRSIFKGNQDLVAYLKSNNIDELHLVGTETNDCVLASAFDAFDLGFPVYLLEECCESATQGRHQIGLDLVRLQGMTNNHCLAETITVER